MIKILIMVIIVVVLYGIVYIYNKTFKKPNKKPNLIFSDEEKLFQSETSCGSSDLDGSSDNFIEEN